MDTQPTGYAGFFRDAKICLAILPFLSDGLCRDPPRIKKEPVRRPALQSSALDTHKFRFLSFLFPILLPRGSLRSTCLQSPPLTNSVLTLILPSGLVRGSQDLETAQVVIVESLRLSAKVHYYNQFPEKSFSTILNFYEFASCPRTSERLSPLPSHQKISEPSSQRVDGENRRGIVQHWQTKMNIFPFQPVKPGQWASHQRAGVDEPICINGPPPEIELCRRMAAG